MSLTADFTFINDQTTELLNELFDGVYILDRNRKILFWNKGAEEISGHAREDIIGIHCNEGPIKHEDAEGCQLCEESCPAVAVMEQNEKTSAVVFLHHANGSLIPVETHINPLRDQSGTVIGAIEIFRDIQHWKEIEELSALKDNLMGILAHDIRNPLAVIKIWSKFLLHHTDPKMVEIGETIERRSNYAFNLVSDLLDAKAIESGTLDLNLQEFNAADVLKQVKENYSHPAQAKNIDLQLLVPDNTHIVYLDPTRFEEIFNNLVSNALNYSNPNTKIEIHLFFQETTFSVKVQDHGIGIKADDRNKLFQAFGKTSSRPTAGESSTGLGLYIVKKIVDLFMGTIQVESEVGKGTSFLVTLPQKIEPSPSN
jgi:PAS domain S-box-containing protein